jgi:nucleotide-binding universal stress UspA family protein
MWFGKKNVQTDAEEEVNLLADLLLVVDGAQPSVAAAHFAVALAAQTGSSITAVYVVDTATMDYLLQMRIFVKEEREEFERELDGTGRRYLDFVATLAARREVALEPVLGHGRFHQTILKEARTRAVSAIVIGGWRRSIMRKDATSVERQLILDQADCPVIVVKDDEPRSAERG